VLLSQQKFSLANDTVCSEQKNNKLNPKYFQKPHLTRNGSFTRKQTTPRKLNLAVFNQTTLHVCDTVWWLIIEQFERFTRKFVI